MFHFKERTPGPSLEEGRLRKEKYKYKKTTI